VRRTRHPSLVGLLLAVFGLLNIPIAAAASPPANDDFDNASSVSALPFADSLVTNDATKAPDDPADCFDAFNRSVWYTFTPPQDVSIQVDSYGTDYQTVLAAYTGARGALTLVGCDTSSAFDRLFLHLAAGTTYYFEVTGWPGVYDSGRLLFAIRDRAQAATNDDISDATSITQLPFKDGSNMAATTRAASDPVCAGVENQSVWYSFTPNEDIRVWATTQHSIFENALAVYVGSPGALTEIACSASFPQVHFDAVAGTTYYLQVAGDASVQSFLNVLLQEAFHITNFVADARARFERGRTVVVSGTVACNHQLGAIQVSGTLSQGAARGSFETSLSCPRVGASATWTATVVSSTGMRFVPGTASLTAQASGQVGGGTYFSADQATTARNVTLPRVGPSSG
jgi:hypothetical protein